jgi:hypothetical protein
MSRKNACTNFVHPLGTVGYTVSLLLKISFKKSDLLAARADMQILWIDLQKGNKERQEDEIEMLKRRRKTS